MAVCRSGPCVPAGAQLSHVSPAAGPLTHEGASDETPYARASPSPSRSCSALAVTPALSGCFGNPIEQVIEGATGGDVDLGGASVPDGFPSEVPLVEGEVLFGARIGNDEGRIWNVTIKVGERRCPRSDRLAARGRRIHLVGRGLRRQHAEVGTAILENANYGVLVVVSQDGDNGFVANYTVTELTQ